MNLETITGTQSWHKIWLLNGVAIRYVQNQIFSGDRKEFTKVSRADSQTESHYIDNSLEFGEA